MGAWIETKKEEEITMKKMSHPYMGAWIETQAITNIDPNKKRRTLTWVRGLKRYRPADCIQLHVAPLHGCVD